MVRLARLPLLSALLLGVSLTALTACSGAPEDDESSAESEDELGKCAAAEDMKWVIHMNEPFDAWNDARWTKFDNHVVPEGQTCEMAANVAVTPEGMLRIATRKEAMCGMPYTGGAIMSAGKFWTGKYFKAEIRAKVSQEQGIFGAPLWFRPGNSTGATPIGGEIDVVESLGKWNKPKLQATIHPDYSDGRDGVAKQKPYADVGDEDGTGFHVYTVEKIPSGITFYVDGKYVTGWGCGHKSNEKRPVWFNKWFETTPDGWSIRIDNKVGGSWAGETDSTTQWGNKSALYIDYIKVYKPKP
jgi:beta-glucanase (GH16 family)